MNEEKQQKELFQFEKPKRPFSKLSRFFPKADFEDRVLVTLTPEQIILVAIGIILCLVVIYAVGVEQGRKNQVETPPALTAAAESRPGPDQSFFATSQVGKIPQTPSPRPTKPVSVRGPQKPSTAPYTIVAATFNGKDSAVKAVNGLKGDGLNAFLTQKDSYFVVYAGAYTDKNDPQALKDLAKVKRRYGDAYIKLR